MTDTTPAWYGTIEPPIRCSTCDHEMFDAGSDADAGVDFCPKCGRQTVEAVSDVQTPQATSEKASG